MSKDTRIETYEEDIAELRNMHFDTRIDERVATAAMFNRLLDELKECYERIDYLEVLAEEYRQERPEEYCANCYAYLEDYDGDGVQECLCSDCQASEEE
jgi:hypothetical protein